MTILKEMPVTVLVVNSVKVRCIASAYRIGVHARVDLILLSPIYTAFTRGHHTRGVNLNESTAVHIYSGHRITEAPTTNTPISTCYCLDSPYIPNIEQLLSAVR